MPTWLVIILVVAVVGALIGFLSGKDGERGENAAAGAAVAATGCAHILFQIFLCGIVISVAMWLFRTIFG